MPFPLLELLIGQQTPPPGSTPGDVVAAVSFLWSSTPAMVAISPKLYLKTAPRNPTYPYAVLTQQGERTRGNSAGLVYTEDKVFQFSIYHTDADALTPMGVSLVSTFDPLNKSKALYFGNGYLQGFRRSGGNLIRMPGRASRATYLYQQTYMYAVTVRRTS